MLQSSTSVLIYFSPLLIGKVVQTEDKLRAIRPYKLGDELDEEVKDEVEKFLKPLCNVIYSKGQYYIY